VIRDWYSLGQLRLLPIAGTLLLHVSILAAIVLRFLPDSNPRTIEARVLPPTVINATLVDAASLKPKKEVRKQAPKPAPKPAVKPAAKPAPKTPAKAAPKPAPKPAPKSAKAPAPKLEPEKRISAEELAAISRRELAAAMAAEDSTPVAVTAEEMSTSYAALIRDTVVNYWSRPPSARNGMEALLAIQLVPTGEIVSVSVVRSSGSVAFDRSAMNAVEKAGSFPELKNLPGGEFEKTFRRFQLLFRPEDLRY
jgi:colicin import membrane protein